MVSHLLPSTGTSAPPKTARSSSASCSLGHAWNAPNAIITHLKSGGRKTFTKQLPSFNRSNKRAQGFHHPFQLEPKRFTLSQEAIHTPGPKKSCNLPPGGGPLKYEANEDPRNAWVHWMMREDNPYFSQAIVNRVWAVFFGKGFVIPWMIFEPVILPFTNPVGGPAKDFVAHGYDLRHLMRTIMSSRLYQSSSTPNDTNIADMRTFRDTIVKDSPQRFCWMPSVTSPTFLNPSKACRLVRAQWKLGISKFPLNFSMLLTDPIQVRPSMRADQHPKCCPCTSSHAFRGDSAQTAR